VRKIAKFNQAASDNRFARKLTSRKRKAKIYGTSRKKPWKSKKRKSRNGRNGRNANIPILVTAPNQINFYKPNYFATTNGFIQDLQSSIKQANSSGCKVKVCFRNTEFISAAAALYLLAETDRSTKKYPDVKFILTFPKTNAKNVLKTSQADVDGILNRLGFYKLLGKQSRKLVEKPHVKCWDHVSGEIADGKLAGQLINKFVTEKIDTSILYRGAVEALSNAVEHAYDDEIKSSANLEDKRWWMLIAKLNGHLIILICDLGHGIPNTLEITQSAELLKKIWSKLGGKNKTHGQYIEASTLVKKTRTEKKHRGKGGKDLTTLVDNYNNSVLSIFSMKGLYKYGNKKLIKGIAYDHKNAINGTIVQWSIPIVGNFK
jgi:hypothetical protein